MTDARYRILRRIGQGGMAEVFEAELVGELGFSRKVAIKRMLADAATELASAHRFIDEARIASRLHHANIVSVTDVGMLDGLPFQVLELVDGINAQQLMARAGGKLPVEIALMIAGNVAHALDHAHSACDAEGLPLGIVHRDVKPANVLLSWGGDVKLGDFGIAVAFDRAAHTQTGVVAGTSGFIAPEQRARSEIDGRTDVFSLGLTLHALVTGYSPLRDVEVEIAVMEGGTVPLDSSLPPDVAELVARAVAPRRRDRSTAGAFAQAIGNVLAPRLPRDARGHLRDFLETFHTTARARAGVLDQLLGLDVVLTAEPADSPPQFSLRQTGVITAVTTPRPRPRRRTFVALAVAGLVLGGGAVATWQLARTTAPAAIVDAGTVVPTGSATVDGATADAATADAAMPIATTDRAMDAAVADAATHALHDPRDAGHGPPRDAAPASVGSGWIQIVGGEGLLGAAVLVDGKPAGHVPYPIEVPAGHHRIELRKADGTPIPGVWNTDVTDETSSAHPLRRDW